MERYELDDVARGILHALQENARDATIEEMDEAVSKDPEHTTEIHDSVVRAGLEIREIEYVRNSYVQPWNHFGAEVVDD